MARLRMAVVGVGHLGKEHARVLAGRPDVELAGVADVNPDQARAIAHRCGTRAYENHRPLLGLVDAAVIAVPTTDHYPVAVDFLRRGVPLLIEKPLAPTPAEADALVELAARQGVTLQVGHIERFNPAFEELQRRRPRPRYVECERLGPFSGRSTDIGVVLDLMIHDLDLLLTLVDAPVQAVEAAGVRVFGQHEDVACARLAFANGCRARVWASRAHAVPRRRMRLWAPEGYAGVDFAGRRLVVAPLSEALGGLDFCQVRRDPAILGQFPEERFGRHLEAIPLRLPGADQLTREVDDFIRCVRTGARPRVAGEEARDAVALAARILASLGAPAESPAAFPELPAA